MGGCASRPKDLRGEAPEADAAAVSVDPAPLNSTEAPVVESMVEGEPNVVHKEEDKVEASEVEKEEPKVEATKEPHIEKSEAEQTAETTVVKEEPPVAAAVVA
ncbi:uncharacterized protein LOC122011162 [Zingiber officinale]|uniref:uncharacterized protein LOC122011162 n=1 Tax=Zingiber officinale TaxID=94328 RepID=UPI001C4AB6FD|nr:uncharacterized protein LOC122011162 [Zingiber officinale]